MVVLGEGDDIALGGDFEAAAARHLHTRALELTHVGALVVKDGDVELVAVRVPDQDVPVVRDVDAVGEASDLLVPDATTEHAVFANHHHAVT